MSLRKNDSGDWDILSGDTNLKVSIAGDESGQLMVLDQPAITVTIGRWVKKPRYLVERQTIKVEAPIGISHEEFTKLYGTLLKKVKIKVNVIGLLYYAVHQVIEVLSGLEIEPFEIKIMVDSASKFKYSLSTVSKIGNKSTTVIKNLKDLKKRLKELK